MPADFQSGQTISKWAAISLNCRESKNREVNEEEKEELVDETKTDEVEYSEKETKTDDTEKKE